MGYCKVGFHCGIAGNRQGITEDYFQPLQAAGRPPLIKSTDDYGVCLESLAHGGIAVFRMTGGDLENPNYDLPPDLAAEQHWARIRSSLPPEFDTRTWLEVMNEPDKNRSAWLGEFCLHMAELMTADGYRFAALGFAAGEPERHHWETPEMLAFLWLAAGRQNKVAVALHEYSYNVADIRAGYPWMIGRFSLLHQVCDARGIQRPTILITEWGWEYQEVPEPGQAMADIAWVAQDIYRPHPNVMAAGLWYLGGEFGGIADKAQRLIAPLGDYAAHHEFGDPPDPPPPPPPPQPGDLHRVLWDATVREQLDRGIRLNPSAAIQREIFRHGFVPVINEFSVDYQGKAYTTQAAEHLGTGERRCYVWIQESGVWWFNEPASVDRRVAE